MSKIYNKYIELKSNIKNKNTTYIFHSGIFFIFIDNDAINMSKLLDLKLIPLGNDTQKCGFPEIKKEKYFKLLEHFNVTYKIIEVNDENVNNSQKIKVSKIDNNKTDEKQITTYLQNNIDTFENNININNILNKIKKLNALQITPKAALEILLELYEELNKN